MLQAAVVGIERRLHSLFAGRQERVRDDGHGPAAWDRDIEGAAGELAFAKAFALYWPGSVDTFNHDGDLAIRTPRGTARLEIRTSGKYHAMMIRPDARDDRASVFMFGRAGTYEVVGWLPQRECKQERWYAARGEFPPAYFVPRAALRPIAELWAYLNGEFDERDSTGAVS